MTDRPFHSFFAALIVLLLAQPFAARAEIRAVLVGVSDYSFLDADLAGPRNDVRIVALVLLKRGVKAENIRILSDNVPGFSTTRPTRENILSALDALAGQSQAGDTAVFYFSGHGAQLPDQNGDEQGGNDEVFLPSDARGGKDGNHVENAIIDDELQIRLRAILAKNTQVVAIVDACFSGTGFRALGGKGVARFIDPAALGLPDLDAAQGAETPLDLPGEFVFLYSSQSNQRSFEYPLGDASDPANWYGDFTRNLVATLENPQSLTWAQALQSTRDAMRGALAQATQTPDGEGPMLAAVVFGATGGGKTRFKIETGELQAGLLAGLNEGAEIAVFATAVGGEPIAHARLKSLSATRATLEILDGQIGRNAYGLVVRPGPVKPLVLSLPVPADSFDGYDYRGIVAAVGRLAQTGLPKAVVFGEIQPDATLILIDGGLALAGPDGVLDTNGPETSPRITLDPGHDPEPQLADWLARYARAYQLRAALTLVERAATGGFGLLGRGLKIRVEIRSGAQTDGKCTKPEKSAQTRELRDGGQIVHCDQLWLHLANNSRNARDITVLYADADFGLSALWPRNNLSNRLGSGEQKSLGFQIVHSGGAARAFEEIIILSVQAQAGDGRTVLTALAENGTSRAAPATPLEAYLSGLSGASPDATNNRGFDPNKKMSPLRVFRYGFEVLPESDF